MPGSADSFRLRGRLIRGAVMLWGLVAISGLSAGGLHADEPPRFPSKVILGLRATCMSTCQEKEDAEPCTRYCDCHLFELRRDLSDSQVEQLLLTAERGGTGAESIRRWLHASAKLCEERVFGEAAGKKKSPE
ncbi:MAG: hypothetical protein JRG89_05585 [Deltaproteobacteria bacterium]|nr:hypothetical protein [Deltaproteobacteria bacterium]MBW2723954.1 hypothetical protein [Deltaproteobacteria bacterium]